MVYLHLHLPIPDNLSNYQWSIRLLHSPIPDNSSNYQWCILPLKTSFKTGLITVRKKIVDFIYFVHNKSDEMLAIA